MIAFITSVCGESYIYFNLLVFTDVSYVLMNTDVLCFSDIYYSK